MRLILFIVSFCVFLFSPISHAVIILDSTYEEFGFHKARDLAKQSQFKSLIFISESASGSWIGNYNGHGYVLTAGHVYEKNADPSEYAYRTLDGTAYQADKLYKHPLWNGDTDDRTGYDFVIVRLKNEVDTAGSQPALYGGSHESGKLLTFIGYGYRGTGTHGQDTEIDTHNKPAGAVGLIEKVVDAVDPAPASGDAGSYLGIWLPKEDGSIPNPFTKKGITKPVSSLSGVLGSGDSGGPAWIETSSGWAIAGINSNGGGNAKYGDASWFARVSHVKDWILSIVPTAKFVE